MFVIDKTIVNLLSIVISGAGLYSVLTKYDVPQLNVMYWGRNPYSIKRDIIDKIMTLIFSVITLLGFIIQAIVYIFDFGLIERAHNSKFYLWFFICGILTITIVVFVSARIGRLIARIFWKPKIIENQQEAYEQAKFIVENNGLREDQIGKMEGISEVERYIEINYQSVDETLNQLEDLFELKNNHLNRQQRVVRLKQFFETTK